MNLEPVAHARSLVKVYGSGEAAVRALDGVDVDLRRGELTAIMGPSGSGKSTLMHCLAGLDAPTSGQVMVGGTEISALSERRLTQLRRTEIGFVFQAFNLVPTLTALENITLPLDIARRPVDRAYLDEVLGFLRRSVDELGQSVVMVTHEPTAAAYAHRVLFLADGHLVGEIEHPTAESVLDALRGLAPRRGRGPTTAPSTTLPVEVGA